MHRFISRLNLPDDAEFKLISYYEQPGFSGNSNCYNNNYPILELYHTVRNYDYNNIFEKIKKNGFTCGMYGNKGAGVYMANHGRYSYDWGYNDDGIRNVIISDVLYMDAGSVRNCFRYRSEIKSNNFNSEYKITDTKTIYPKCFITYRVDNHQHNMEPYVEHGQFGCDKCDMIIKRCDCLLEGYDEFDLI